MNEYIWLNKRIGRGERGEERGGGGAMMNVIYIRWK